MQAHEARLRGVAELGVQPRQGRRAELPVVDPAAVAARARASRASGTGSRRRRGRSPAARCDGAPNTARANASRTSWLPGHHSTGPGSAPSTARASAYSSGGAVVGHVAGHDRPRPGRAGRPPRRPVGCARRPRDGCRSAVSVRCAIVNTRVSLPRPPLQPARSDRGHQHPSRVGPVRVQGVPAARRGRCGPRAGRGPAPRSARSPTRRRSPPRRATRPGRGRRAPRCRRAGRRRRARAPGRPTSEGCTRAITNVGEVIAAADAQPRAEPLGEGRLARARARRRGRPGRPAPSAAARRRPRARMASASGTSYAVGPGRSSRTYGASPPTSVKPSWRQKRTVRGQLLAGPARRPAGSPTAASSAAATQRRGDPVVPGVGHHADAAQEQRVAVGVEHQGADRFVVVHRRAARRGPPGPPRSTSTVSPSASAGGSRAGRAPKAARTTASTSRGRLAGPDPTHAQAVTVWARPAASSASRPVVDLVVALHDHHVAGVRALEQVGAVDVRVQLAAVADAGDLVARCRR